MKITKSRQKIEILQNEKMNLIIKYHLLHKTLSFIVNKAQYYLKLHLSAL